MKAAKIAALIAVTILALTWSARAILTEIRHDTRPTPSRTSIWQQDDVWKSS